MYDMNAGPYAHKGRNKQEGTRPEPILWPDLRFRENKLKVLPFSSKIAFECFSLFVSKPWRVMEIKTFEHVGAMTNWTYKNR